MILAVLILFGIIATAIAFLFVASEWKVFQKAGKPGWASLIPFYDGWTLAQVGGKPAWWGVLTGFSVTVHASSGSSTSSSTIPFGVVAALGVVGAVLFILWFLISLGVARNFGKSTAFGFLLGVLPFVGYPILGFGSASYEPKQQKEQLSVIVLIAAIAAVLLGGGLALYHAYTQNSQPIYTKLATENYQSNGTKFSFEYPAIMKIDKAAIASSQSDKSLHYQTPIVYVDNLKNPVLYIYTSIYNIEPALQYLNITSVQLMSQIQHGSGSYITATNKQSGPNTYHNFYGNCGPTITNIAGQTSLVCTNTYSNDTHKNEIQVNIFGFTSKSQYNIQLFMPVKLWNDQQDTWTKIEKSFTYQ